ncbi:uncharacterized protein LOC114941952 [Nylanderia fulva]|uniref:uncharacterized protein LOC114941952 n=1 Tax=Nylanderia fulva TaxID=613905 RepID=UPI0010FB9DBE|nr:uncharacterized protein LOC114941952 [Nylanderia fulva]XP_029172989.1 uncharacterized protein LOC114941952 [Nylanderia fulva]
MYTLQIHVMCRPCLCLSLIPSVFQINVAGSGPRWSAWRICSGALGKGYSAVSASNLRVELFDMRQRGFSLRRSVPYHRGKLAKCLSPWILVLRISRPRLHIGSVSWRNSSSRSRGSSFTYAMLRLRASTWDIRVLGRVFGGLAEICYRCPRPIGLLLEQDRAEPGVACIGVQLRFCGWVIQPQYGRRRTTLAQ